MAPDNISRLIDWLAWAQRELHRGNRLLNDLLQHEHSDAAGHKENDDDSIEEVGGSLPSGSKRARGDGEVEFGRAVKRGRRSADEERLIPYHTSVPKDATPISFPSFNRGGYDPDQDWAPQRPSGPQQNMAGPRFRPQNTLNNRSKQSGKSNGNDQYRPFKKYTDPEPDKLPTQSVRGGNVSRRPEFPDDISLVQPPAKKRRTDNIPSSDHVDLTEDDDAPIGRAVERESKRPPASRSSEPRFTGRLKANNQISASYEQNSVDDMMDTAEALKARCPSHNTRDTSSHASAQGSDRPKSVNGVSQHHNGTRGSPFVLIDDGIEDQTPKRVRQDGTGPGKSARNETGSRPPLIDLGDGMDEYAARHQERLAKNRRTVNQGSEEDMNGVNNLLRSSARRRAPGQASVVQDQQQRRSMLPSASHEQSSIGYSQSSPQRTAGRLADSFQRDDGTSRKPKLTQQMQKTSSRPSASEDELNGARTVASASSRNTSPQKQAPKPGTAPARRSHEPSTIKPTIFTRGGKLLTDAPQTSQPGPEEQDIDDADDVRIPVKSVFCKACLLSQQGLELVWDSELSGFVVVCQNFKVRTPSKEQVVRIGAPEVQTYTEAKGLNAVWMRGAMTDISNGHVLVEFQDPEGVSLCYATLLDAIKTLNHETISDDRMIKVFERKPMEIQQMNAKSMERRPVQNNQTSRQIRQQPAGDERIIYEGEPKTRPPKIRDRMQGGSLVDELNQAGFQNPREPHERERVTSKFFADEPPRRSTRSKPVEVKERSNSPERWTRIHNPPKWPHSVVYPDSGPRRVTVDFNDLERLDEGEFLNDNVVNFELRCIEESMAPEHRDKVHFFNTFFFSSLSQKNGKKDFNYEAVSRWTKKIDLFSISYVVVPINIDLHWFVAIICNLPAIVRKFNGFDDDEKEDEEDPSATNSVNGQVDAQDPDVQVERQSSANAPGSPLRDTFEFGEDGRVIGNQAVDDDQVPTSSRPGTATSKKGKKKGAKITRKYDPKEPIIMSLDSFALGRSAEIKYLKLYVAAEAHDKRGMELEWNTLQGMSAKGIPEQPNFCDCGVYLLGYVAEFAKDPDAFVRKVLTREMDEDNDFAGFDASAKRNEIRDRLLKAQERQEAERVAHKRARAAAKSGQTPKAQEKKPAENTKIPTPDATAQKSSTPAPVQSKADTTKPNAEAPSSSAPTNSVRRKTPTVDESDELEVQPPNFIGQSSHEELHKSVGDQLVDAVNGDGEDDDDEMLDGDPDEHPSTDQQEHRDVYQRDLPFGSSMGATKASSPPTRFAIGRATTISLQIGRKKTPQPSSNVINVDDSEDESKAAEIPDS